MEQYIEDMQPVCFGRFMMGIPRNSTAWNGLAEYVFANFEVDEKKRTLAQFNLTVDWKLEELKKTSGAARAMFHSEETLSPDVRIANEYAGELIDYFSPIAYVYRDGTTITIKGADVEKKEDYERKFKAKLIELLLRLKALPHNVLPQEAGFCMVGAYIAGPNQVEGEIADFGIDLKDHDDVTFNVRTTVIDAPRLHPMLVDREGSIVKQMGTMMSGVKTLRKRKFQINGQEAQEWSISTRDKEGVSYQFLIEVRGVPKSASQPEMHIEMNVGGYGPGGWHAASLSEGQAMALWDALLDSIKLRPGAL